LSGRWPEVEERGEDRHGRRIGRACCSLEPPPPLRWQESAPARQQSTWRCRRWRERTWLGHGGGVVVALDPVGRGARAGKLLRVGELLVLPPAVELAWHRGAARRGVDLEVGPIHQATAASTPPRPNPRPAMATTGELRATGHLRAVEIPARPWLPRGTAEAWRRRCRAVCGQGREGGRARVCRSGEEGVCGAVGRWRSGEEGGARRDGVLRAGREMVGEGGGARRLRCRRLQIPRECAWRRDEPQNAAAFAATAGPCTVAIGSSFCRCRS
jgi:hypothetical protein